MTVSSIRVYKVTAAHSIGFALTRNLESQGLTEAPLRTGFSFSFAAYSLLQDRVNDNAYTILVRITNPHFILSEYLSARFPKWPRVLNRLSMIYSDINSPQVQRKPFALKQLQFDNNITLDQSRVPLERTAFHRHVREHVRSLVPVSYILKY